MTPSRRYGPRRSRRDRLRTRGLAIPGLVLLLLWLGVLVPRAVAGELLPHERYTLDNGLDVVLHVDRRLPVVAVDLTYHVGTMHDGEHPGLAHLVEHLMFRGTTHLRDGELDGRLFEAGALGTNASTQADQTTYHTVVPAAQLPLALWLESDRMANMLPALTSTKVAEERRTTIDEWEFRVQSERDGATFLEMWNTIFGEGHPYRHADPEAIGQLRIEHVRDFVGRYYGPANATLVLAGDLPPDVRERVERAFGRRQGGERPPRVEVAIPPATAQREIVRVSELATTPLVLLAWPTPGLHEPGDAEADVLAATLNAHRLSEMLEAIEPGQFLDLHVRQFSRTGQSLLMISAHGNAQSDPARMLAALDVVLQRLRDEPLSPDDVRRARRRYAVDFLRGLQGLGDRARRMQLYVATGQPPDWLDEDLQRYAEVDENDVASFVRTHLDPRRRIVVLAHPAGAEP